MKKRSIYRGLSIILFVLGVLFLVNSKVNITGAIIGVSLDSGWSSSIGIVGCWDFVFSWI